jgi:hypothetical protein
MGPRKEPRYTFPLQKVPTSKSPTGSPTGPLLREKPAYRAFLCISWYISLSQRPYERVFPHVPQTQGPNGNRCPFQSLNISFGVSSKGALPPGPPHGVPLEFGSDVEGPLWRELPVSSLNNLLGSPLKKPSQCDAEPGTYMYIFTAFLSQLLISYIFADSVLCTVMLLWVDGNTFP